MVIEKIEKKLTGNCNLIVCWPNIISLYIGKQILGPFLFGGGMKNKYKMPKR